MNKKIFSIMAAAGLVLFASSCADPDLGPIVTFDTAGKGAYVRLVEDNGNQLINLLDLAASGYQYSVEFVDLERGDWPRNCLMRDSSDRNPDNGDNSTGKIELRTLHRVILSNLLVTTRDQ
ncbi:MAG: hypothetical protein R2824_27685 [Saprospiraceae bacterium]